MSFVLLATAVIGVTLRLFGYGGLQDCPECQLQLRVPGARHCPMDGSRLRNLSAAGWLMQRAPWAAALAVVVAFAGWGAKAWPPVKRTRVKPPPAAVTFTLSIDSSPQGAAVLLDGRPSGETTPLANWPVPDLGDGDVLRVSLTKPCYEPAETAVTLGAAETAVMVPTVTLREKPFKVALSSQPAGATVEGAPVDGTTPLELEIPCDGLTVELAKDDYVSRKVTLTRDKSTYSVKLEKTARRDDRDDKKDEKNEKDDKKDEQAIEYTLTLDSQPSGAEVWINGRNSGKTTGVKGWKLPASHRQGDALVVELRSPCFASRSKTVTLAQDKTLNLGRLTLERIQSTVCLTSDPTAADVFDGKDRLGATPLDVPVACGQKRAVRLVRECYAPLTVEVEGVETESIRDVGLVAERSSVEIRSEPKGATVFDGERKLGDTPLALDLACGEMRVVEIRKPCYTGQRLTVRADAPVPAVTLIDNPADPACPSGAMVLVNGIWMDMYEFPNRPGVVPVINVTYDEAAQRCEQIGKKLCDVDDLIRACEGPTGGRKFLYGDRYDNGRCNMGAAGNPFRNLKIETAGQREGCKTPDGLYDLKGNAGEWAQGGSPPSQKEASVYGEPSGQPQRYSTCDLYTHALKDVRSPTIGFRCCQRP